jgi:hypothetical protein
LTEGTVSSRMRDLRREIREVTDQLEREQAEREEQG